MWSCDETSCPSTAFATIMGHIHTFDGVHYGLSGHECEYVFFRQKQKTEPFVSIDVAPCGADTTTSCIKGFSFVFKLKSKIFSIIGDMNKLTVNDVETQFYSFMTLSIRQISQTVYQIVETKSGIEILWDQQAGLFVTLSEEHQRKITGLGGNYDGAAKDEFTSSIGIPETLPCIFANTYKMRPNCKDVRPAQVKDPCSVNSIRLQDAEKYCTKLATLDSFKKCHGHISPDEFIHACQHDFCSCLSSSDTQTCYCSAMSAYEVRDSLFFLIFFLCFTWNFFQFLF